MMSGVRAWLDRSLRHKLVLGMALVHITLTTLVLGESLIRNRQVLQDAEQSRARALTRSLATVAAPWIAGNDMAGLKELLDANALNRGVLESMLLSADGGVMAHSDPARIGQRVAGLPSPPAPMVVTLPSRIDVVEPVRLGATHVGWSRIALDRAESQQAMNAMLRDGALLGLAAVLIGILVAERVGTGLARKLGRLEITASRIRAGQVNLRADTTGSDEAARLAAAFNSMLDAQISTEQRWKLAVEGSGLGVWDWNAQTERVHFSTRWKSMLGYEDSEIGETFDEWSRRVHPDDLPHCQAAIERHFAGETAGYRSEHRLRHKDGGWRWILATGMVFERTADGRPLRVIGTHADMTGVRRTHDELERQNRMLRSIAQAHAARLVQDSGLAAFDHLLMGLMDASGSTRGRIASLPANADGELEWLAENRDGTPWLAVDSGTLARFAAGGPPVIDGHRLLVPLVLGGGVEGLLDVEGRAGAYDAGVVQSLDLLLATTAELLHSLKQDRRRRQAEQELEVSDQRANQIIENAPDAMLVVGDDGCIVRANAHALRIFGYRRRDDLEGRSVELLIPASLHERHRGHRAHYVQQPDHRSMGAGLVVNGVRADGSEFPVEISLAPLAPLMRGPQRQTIVSVLDITLRQQLERDLIAHRDHLEELVEVRTRDLQAAQAEAERLSRVKSEFLANMSHEIRTPMNAIVGLSYLVRSEIKDPAIRERLDQVVVAADHLMRVINDILDLSKIESGKLELDQVDFSLAGLLERCQTLVAESARLQGIELSFDRGGVPDRLRGDPTRLLQALLNLVANAVKFTQSGSVRTDVSIVSETEHRLRLRFRVTDTGIGIEQRAQAALFTAFVQADPSTTRRFGGTGLGLVITQRLAALMGGETGVVSEMGRGSEFWFTAELQRGQSEIAPVQPSRAIVEDELRQVGAGARVLIVEDNPVNQEVARLMLELAGLEVDVADNGAEAVERAAAARYDLVLMDMQMPVMDGLQATQRIRALPKSGQMPILAMTANAFAEDRAACLAAGMDDHVTKPVNPDELYATVLHWLRHPSRAAAGPVH